MNLFKKLFGEKNATAAATAIEPAESASPIARRLHGVVTAMCAKPGR